MSLKANHLTIHRNGKELTVQIPENYDSIYVYGGCDRQVSVHRHKDDRFEVTTETKQVEQRELV